VARQLDNRPTQARLRPEGRSNQVRVDPEPTPPCAFIAAAVDLAMVNAAERHRELIAHFAAERPRLRRPKMMWNASGIRVTGAKLQRLGGRSTAAADGVDARPGRRFSHFRDFSDDRLRRRTPGPPPFSSMNSTPAHVQLRLARRQRLIKWVRSA
jgi:hypothetical protein